MWNNEKIKYSCEKKKLTWQEQLQHEEKDKLIYASKLITSKNFSPQAWSYYEYKLFDGETFEDFTEPKVLIYLQCSRSGDGYVYVFVVILTFACKLSSPD